MLKFVTALIRQHTVRRRQRVWTKAETLLYCALVAYIVFEGPEVKYETPTWLVEMIKSMEVREDDQTFKNAVDYMFDGGAPESPYFARGSIRRTSWQAVSYALKDFLIKRLQILNTQPKTEESSVLMRKNEKSHCSV